MALKSKQSTNSLRGSQMSGGQTPPGWTDQQANVARQVMVEFMNAGTTSAGASGVVGNWFQESALNPGEGGGYLAQWLGSRLAALQTFASSIGAPITSVEAQSRFAIQEIKSGYPEVWKLLTTTKDPKLAALIISQQYERPASWAANNTNRQNQAVAALQYLGGGVSGAVAAGGGPNNASGGGGGGAGGPSSVLDLLTSPVDTLGGWLAKIAFNLAKDFAIAIEDDLIVPFWHWNQRAVDNYLANVKGNDLLWTATFWGFGYALLFTDPESGNLAPAPVRRSRAARHVRRAQSVPARMSLVKPKDVERKTPKKPKPRISTATVNQTGTMQAIRNAPVRVTGTHARESDDTGNRSEIPIEREGTRTIPREKRDEAAQRLSNAEHRAGIDSLSRGSGTSRRHS